MAGKLKFNIVRVVARVMAVIAVGAVIAACSTSTPHAAIPPSPTPAASTPSTVDGPVGSTTTTSVPSTAKSTTSTTQVSIPLSAITDTGLPSKVGPGPLPAATVKSLMQFFENHVSQEFAAGDANGLQAYLAGSMLTGNKGTINVLNAQSRRNIYQIDVTKIIINNNETDRVVFEMKGNMTEDYFENTTTNQEVADGLPGPSAVDFLVFLDFNPANHTWYWTGEQNYSTTTGTS